MFSHINPILLIQEQRKERNHIISFKNIITTLTKDVDVNYALLAIKFEEEVISLMKVVLKKKFTKNIDNVSHYDISYFFWCKRSF
jgi:hypothetical protein